MVSNVIVLQVNLHVFLIIRKFTCIRQQIASIFSLQNTKKYAKQTSNRFR